MTEACSCNWSQVQQKPVMSFCETSPNKVSVRRTANSPKSLLMRLAERIYESCVAFNLRYCSLQGLSTRSAIRNSIRDVFLLVCFLVANAVVFCAIVCRAAVDVYAAVRLIIKAIRMRMSSKQQQTHDHLLHADGDYQVTSSDSIN